MLEDIFNVPVEVKINGKAYKAEYDYNSYAMLEVLTGKGFYKIYNLLMVQNNLTLHDSIEVICCALIKHHTEAEVKAVREYLQANLYAIQDLNADIIGAFTIPILAPEIVNSVQEIKKKVEEMKKKI